MDMDDFPEVIAGVLVIALWVAVIFIAVHFIGKFW